MSITSRSLFLACRTSAQIAVVCALAAVFTCAGCRSEPRSPQEIRARGDALLHRMSATLAKASTLSVDVEESHDRVRRNGQKVSVTSHRKFIVRRPDRLAFHQTGAERDFSGWYDGATLTIVGNRDRIFVRTPVPATLDQLFDRLADRYAMPMPVADLLHSSPYDALIGEGVTGGWAGTDTINGKACDRLEYTHPTVGFTLHVSSAQPIVPCRFEVVDTQEPARPASRVTFTNWNLAAKVDETTFTAVIPANYEEIPMVERFSKSELNVQGSKSQTATPAKKNR